MPGGSPGALSESRGGPRPASPGRGPGQAVLQLGRGRGTSAAPGGRSRPGVGRGRGAPSAGQPCGPHRVRGQLSAAAPGGPCRRVLHVHRRVCLQLARRPEGIRSLREKAPTHFHTRACASELERGAGRFWTLRREALPSPGGGQRRDFCFRGSLRPALVRSHRHPGPRPSFGRRRGVASGSLLTPWRQRGSEPTREFLGVLHHLHDLLVVAWPSQRTGRSWRCASERWRERRPFLRRRTQLVSDSGRGHDGGLRQEQAGLLF